MIVFGIFVFHLEEEICYTRWNKEEIENGKSLIKSQQPIRREDTTGEHFSSAVRGGLGGLLKLLLMGGKYTPHSLYHLHFYKCLLINFFFC